LVKDLQEKLKKEIHLNEEVNKKLKKSNKEIGHLRSHITKLEKEFDLMKNQISSRQIMIFFLQIFNF